MSAGADAAERGGGRAREPARLEAGSTEHGRAVMEEQSDGAVVRRAVDTRPWERQEVAAEERSGCGNTAQKRALDPAPGAPWR